MIVARSWAPGPVRLLCLPFAGGSAYTYGPLLRALGDLPVTAIELPGRGARIREALVADFEQLAEESLRQVLAAASGGRFVLFGHSMGGRLAYLVAHAMRERGLGSPMHLVLSGAPAPSRPLRRLHDLPADRFLAAVQSLGGLPREIAEQAEARELFLPILRADFRAAETWTYRQRPPLDVDLTLLYGRRDPLCPADPDAWRCETSAAVSVHELAGDHFFLFEQLGEVAALLRRLLTKLGAAAPSNSSQEPVDPLGAGKAGLRSLGVSPQTSAPEGF